MKTVHYTISGLVFEWDEDKARLVLQEHSVTMEEAASIFLDDNLMIFEDTRHYDEQRLFAVGMSNQARLLTVCWTERAETVRIITAFKASNDQQKRYTHGH